MKTTTALYLSACVLAIVPACTADATHEDELAELADDVDDAKDDRPDLPFEIVRTEGPPRDRETARVGIIKTEQRWLEVFGQPAPAALDFDRRWVAYYVAGTSGDGVGVEIRRVRLSDTGKTLKVATRLEQPDAACAQAEPVSFPYAVVSFAKPATAPTAHRYSREVVDYACTDPTCARGDLRAATEYVIVSEDEHRCAREVDHCVTRNPNACPEIDYSPLRFCDRGETARSVTYAPSTDGQECELTTLHCITLDPDACPPSEPVPPGFCPDGEIVTERRLVPSTDGLECAVAHHVCLVACHDA